MTRTIMIEKSTDGNFIRITVHGQSHMVAMTDWSHAISRATLFTAPPTR